MFTWNRQAALAMLGDDPVLFAEVLRELRQEMPAQFALLKSAVASAHADDARRAAHTLKGLAAQIAAETLRSAVEECEHWAKNGEMAKLAAQLPLIERLHETLMAELAKG